MKYVDNKVTYTTQVYTRIHKFILQANNTNCVACILINECDDESKRRRLCSVQSKMKMIIINGTLFVLAFKLYVNL